MPEQKNIETGVDKLVDIINRKSRVSLDDAAKELGVSKEVVQEWADFLEDEGLITVEDKLNKTFLCERKLNKTEVEKKTKEYSSKKDAFTRKIETALSSLQRESAGLDQIKSEFEKLKAVIGGDIDEVKGELEELRHYEDLKKSMDKEIMQQRLDYQAMLEGIHKRISDERKRSEGFIDAIGSEKSKIEEAKVELSFMEKRQDNLQKRIDALKEILKTVENEIVKQKNKIRDSVDRTEAQLKNSEGLQKDMRHKLELEMEPLLKKVKNNEEKILTVQNSLLKKVMAKNKEIEKYKFESLEAADKFKTFFDKRMKTQYLIETLEKDKKEIEVALQELIRKAKSFNLTMKSSDVKNYVKELEVNLSRIEKKKSGFLTKLAELTEHLSGK